jgi:ABC-type sugar transport system ATPase subunit
MTTVSFDQASKFFGAVAAVSDLTLDIADAEFMVLVGPSGSGKTTALRLLAGLEGLSSGHLRIGPETVDRMSPRDRDIAMVFQDYALYPQMSVASNMEFGLKMRKLPRREIGDRVRQAAEVLGLTEYLKRKPGELSGGQRQRVALGRALVREPKVFLMDEPLSNLDASLRAQMRGEIRRLQKEVGTTTVYVTHDQIEAMTMGDRIGVMKDGRLLQVAAPGTLYNHPVNAFVGGFIGSPAMSFGHFKCERLGSSISMRQGGVELISRHPGEVPASRDNVLIGVRPEHVHLWDSERGLLGPVDATVATLEAHGRETFLWVDTEAGKYAVVVEGDWHPGLGDRVKIGFSPGSLMLFDVESTELIGKC